MHLVAALPVQTGCGDEAGPIISRRGQEDEVAGKSLIFFHQDHVSNLRQTHRKFVSTKKQNNPSSSRCRVFKYSMSLILLALLMLLF